MDGAGRTGAQRWYSPDSQWVIGQRPTLPCRWGKESLLDIAAIAYLDRRPEASVANAEITPAKFWTHLKRRA